MIKKDDIIYSSTGSYTVTALLPYSKQVRVNYESSNGQQKVKGMVVEEEWLKRLIRFNPNNK